LLRPRTKESEIGLAKRGRGKKAPFNPCIQGEGKVGRVLGGGNRNTLNVNFGRKRRITACKKEKKGKANQGKKRKRSTVSHS